MITWLTVCSCLRVQDKIKDLPSYKTSGGAAVPVAVPQKAKAAEVEIGGEGEPETPNNTPQADSSMFQFKGKTGDPKDVVDALQAKLGKLSTGGEDGEDDEDAEEEGEPLPEIVAARVEALKKLQEDRNAILAKYTEERTALEAKYQAKQDPLYTARAAIVKGAAKVEGEDEAKAKDEADGNEIHDGIPGFWLRALTNHPMVAEMVTPRDAEALVFLSDITCKNVGTGSEDDKRGFQLEFTFEPNPFFENATLTKKYTCANGAEPLVNDITGTEINWKEGKNLCKIMKKKKQRSKKGKERVITEETDCPSFFQYFAAPEIPEDENALSRDDMDELNHQIDSDFELGQIFQSQFVPKAFLYFMGEVDDSDEEDSDYEPEEGDDDDEDEDEDDEEESDEEESDEEQAPKGKGGKKGGRKGGNPAGGPENPEECKQQ